MKTDRKKLYQFIITISAAILVIALLFIILKPISKISGWLNASARTPVKYSEADEYPVYIENITLESMPSSIICLDVNALDVLISLGYEEVIKGVCDGYDSDKYSQDMYFGSAQNPDFEKILLFKPDMLITSYPIPSARMTALSELDITVLVLPEYKIDNETGQNNYTAILSLIGGNPQGTVSEAVK